jgi:hypothetical protein
MRVDIELDGSGRGRVVIGGQDISGALRGIVVRGGVGEAPRLELDLDVFDVTRLESAEMEILIPDDTRDALIALGWTPPQVPSPRPSTENEEYKGKHRRKPRGNG